MVALPLGLAPVDFPLVLFGFTEAVVDSWPAVVVATGELAPPSATTAGSRDKRERVIFMHFINSLSHAIIDVPWLM